MIVISDTNILSSFAAADALDVLFKLFSRSKICIPPSVLNKLQIGRKYNKTYLVTVFELIEADDIEVLQLSRHETQLSMSLPSKLNAGECEGIALCQNQNLRFLSNDRRAVHYCHRNSIRVLDLMDILRLLWTQDFLTPFKLKH